MASKFLWEHVRWDHGCFWDEHTSVAWRVNLPSSLPCPVSGCMRCSCHGRLNHKPDTNLITRQQWTLHFGMIFSVFVLLVSFEWEQLKYRRYTRKTGAAERCPESLRLFARCIPRSPCCSSRRPSLWPPCLQRLDLERQKRTDAFLFLKWSTEIFGLTVFPGGLWDVTCVGGFADDLGVVCAHDHLAPGAGSTQQRVNSHSHVLHQVKLGAVWPHRRPDSLPVTHQEN